MPKMELTIKVQIDADLTEAEEILLRRRLARI